MKTTFVKIFIFVWAFVLVLLVFSCKTFKEVSCVSKKTVPVTFITKSGKYYTLQLPYCDTVQLTKDTNLDSVEVRTIITAKQ